MKGSGYCSATEKELKTPVGVVDGSETGPSEMALTFPGPGCPKKHGSEEDNEGHARQASDSESERK
jgi:hypothetical protein